MYRYRQDEPALGREEVYFESSTLCVVRVRCVVQTSDGKDRISEDSAFGICPRADACLALAHASGAHCPVHIHTILDRSPLPFHRGLHLISQELHNGSCLSLSRRRWSFSSGNLFPLISAIFRQSRLSRKDSDLREFVRVTGATYVPLFSPPLSTCIRMSNAFSSREARRYLDKHLRLDTALQSYMNTRENAPTPSSSEVEKLFNKYKGVQLLPVALAHRFLTYRHQTASTTISP